jgi:glycosyltransferase involved in cell wall biosynthesis
MNEKESYNKLATYNVMLFPTEYESEGIPGSIVDAYIAGLPVIATEWPVCRDVVIDGKTGIVIPMYHSDALFSTMKDVIDGKINLIKMSENCQNEALKYKTSNVLSIDFLHDINLK